MNFFPHFAHTQQPAKKWGKKCSTGRGSFAPKLLLTKSILKCKNVTFLDLICQDLSLLLLLILLTFTNNILINLFAFLVLTIFFPPFQPFKRFVEIGRITVLQDGPHEGKIAAIVDVIDQNRVLLDGPCSGMKQNLFSSNYIV